ncbi:glycosyltransferase [Cylindrospermopsis raciborskii]|uniref:glycosyltransferase n=1 Tax=Cylindrospermopsis raciborskii TaxID=77022 RepID=UPI001F4406F4|nr:glycosyltransferase [Cylindrospermopsis raciborskii]UJS05648.1 glycosyltransferase [Cylindrospermopsis raciborskii KLL07]
MYIKKSQAPKPRILVLIDYYLPGYKSGGPLRTLSNMVTQLSDSFEFLIVTRDRDFNDTHPYNSVKIGVWTHQGKAQVFYIPKVQWGIWSISRILRETPHDILYLNSFFSPWMTGLPLLLRYLKQFDTVPIILAPRGEFSPGALQLKAGKKKLYMAVLFSLGLCRNLIWQASSDKEGVDIHNVFHKAEKGSDIKIAPDLPDMLYAKKYIPNDNQISPTEINSLKILFISRISPKKNLDFLLRVLRNVSSPVDLSIYGPIDDSNYWSTCQALINDLPRQIKFEFGGEIEHEKVAGIFRNRVYQKLKGFKEDYPLSSDADFYLRALLSNLKFSRFSGESISCFRIHENQLTNKIKRSYGS